MSDSAPVKYTNIGEDGDPQSMRSYAPIKREVL